MFNLQVTPRDGDPYSSVESIGTIEVHKSFLMEMVSRKSSIVNVVANTGKFPTTLNVVDIIKDKGFEEIVRYATTDNFQYVNKEDLDRLVITISGTSLRMIQRIITALSLDIATLFDGFSYDIVRANYMDKNWVSGHVLANYELDDNRKSYFKNLVFGGWMVDMDLRNKAQALVHKTGYSGKVADVFQGNLDELDDDIPYCRQVVKANHLFSFRGISDKLRDGRDVKELLRSDFTNVNALFTKVNNLETLEEKVLAFGVNSHTNVNTFIVDIAVPYVDGDEVKVKHITFAHMDDYQELYLMDNTFRAEPKTYHFDGDYITSSKLPDYYIEYPEKLKR